MCDVYELWNRIRYIQNLQFSRAGSYSWPAPTPGPLLLPARSYSRPAPTPGPLLLPARSYSRPAPTPGPLLLLARSYSWPAPTPGPSHRYTEDQDEEDQSVTSSLSFHKVLIHIIINVSAVS